MIESTSEGLQRERSYSLFHADSEYVTFRGVLVYGEIEKFSGISPVVRRWCPRESLNISITEQYFSKRFALKCIERLSSHVTSENFAMVQ
jgi:hypothetical protein